MKTAVVFVALVVIATTGVARASLVTGKDKLLHGKYAAAIKDLKKVKGKDAAIAKLALARAYLRIGDVKNAKTAAKAAGKDKARWADAQELLAEIAEVGGHYADARKLLEAATAKAPDHLRVRWQLALVYDTIGEHALADAIWDRFVDDANAGQIADTAENHEYLAEAVTSYQQASEELQRATRLDPTLLEAEVRLGDLFLEKYSAADAIESYRKVLAIDPAYPDALVGEARAELEETYATPAVLAGIAAALAVNPRHSGALDLRAKLELDDEDHDDALATLAKALKVNPNDREAHAVRAAVYWQRDDSDHYEAERAATLAIDPTYSRFYRIVADSAERAHRYEDAITLDQQAIALDPGDALAEADLGIAYLQAGQDDLGLEALNKAFAADPYNRRAYNLLNLFDVLAKDYVTFDAGKHFHFRMPKSQRAILERYVPKLLDQAWDDMVARYHFTPSEPITVELFDDDDQYSVRTVGLPGIASLGVTFGKVITARSPSLGGIDWGSVLWHELGHVFALQLSKSRVPRWFTEGLSEYETARARPEWQREGDQWAWHALRDNEVPSIGDLDRGFLLAPSVQAIVDHYYLAWLTVQYLADTYGFDAIVGALKAYGDGKDTATILREVTGQDVATLDKGLRASLEQRLGGFRDQLDVDPGGDLDALAAAAKKHPRDAAAQASLALAYLDEDPDQAKAAADRALALDAKNARALYASAMLDRAPAGRKTKLQAVLDAGADGYAVRLELGRIAALTGDRAEAGKQLARAETFDPQQAEPFALLAIADEDAGDAAARLIDLEAYLRIDESDGTAYPPMLALAVAKKDWAAVRQYGENALYVIPFDATLHGDLAKAYEALGDKDAAAFERASAKLATP